MFDIQSLTLGEVAAIEDLAGVSVDAMADDDRPKGRLLAAFIFVMKRREDPGFKFEDALNIPLSEANELLGTPDPTVQ